MPTEPQTFLQQMQQVESLVAAVEQGTDPAARAAAQDLVRTLLEVHAGALARMLELLPEAGQNACADDELISNVLLLHSLHPLGLEARVRRALDQVRPLLHRGGGEMKLLSVTDAMVRVRLEADPGCGSTVAALKGAVQRAILDAAPEVAAVDVEGFGESAPALLQIGTMSRNGQAELRAV
jgi:Fe-S cluster biogenesis protein NfuA